MEIILLRHGKSPPLWEAGVASDEDRPLTEEGQAQAKRAGKALRAMGCRPDVVLSSPLLRARLTAERAVQGLGGKFPVEVFRALEPGTSPADLVRAVAGRGKASTLLLVGHQPDLGALASRLAFGAETPAIAIKPGGMLLLEVEGLSVNPEGRLKWLLLPSQIESLG